MAALLRLLLVVFDGFLLHQDANFNSDIDLTFDAYTTMGWAH
ncbi:hypothetical protein OH492_17785 [Vibrio chagasii]|nr:hypothetical protein [Vibrio chagasii]